MRFAVLIVSLLFPVLLQAQTSADWEDAFHQWIDTEEVESASTADIYDNLSELAANPININRATREELEQLPFLTPQQIEELMGYIARYGAMRSVGELQMLTSLDADRRHLLLYFIYIGEPQKPDNRLRLDSILQHSKHQILLSGRIPLYERKGDRNGYLGPKYRHTLRYQMTYHDRVKLGLTGAQDAGEPFFSNKNRWGYDHYSYYLQMKDLGSVKNLCVGMYQVQWGMGLVMNGGFYLGKLATLQSMGRSTTMLRPHSSRSTQGYLQGAAATIQLHKNWQITAFASYRPLDATLNKDNTARTLLTSSYHRTPIEMAKKNNTHETDFGGSIGWRKGTLYAHANMLYTHLDRKLNPQKENFPYRRYAAEGNRFVNASIDYGYTNARLSFSGETAIQQDGAIATIHRLGYRFGHSLNLMLLHRYYDKKYTALHAQSFSEGGDVQNEHGVYVGLTWQPSSKLNLQWYADFAHFSWKRYQVSLPSDAFDTMILARTLFNNIWKLEARYRLHVRQKDNQEKTFLLNRTEQKARLRLCCDMPFGLSLLTQLDGILVNFKGKEKGWMLSEQAVYQWRKFQLSGHICYFQTDSYESRLYQYERTLLYNYASQMLYGKGIRYAMMARADIGKHLMLIAKLGVTNYFDRSKISSGYQEINGSSMADVDVQVRWKF